MFIVNKSDTTTIRLILIKESVKSSKTNSNIIKNIKLKPGSSFVINVNHGTVHAIIKDGSNIIWNGPVPSLTKKEIEIYPEKGKVMYDGNSLPSPKCMNKYIYYMLIVVIIILIILMFVKIRKLF